MRSPAALPKSVLVLEGIGMVLLVLAWLSLNAYITLPAPFASQMAGIIMIFLGILLMLPAAAAVIWRMASVVAPQLMHQDKTHTAESDRKKDDDAHH